MKRVRIALTAVALFAVVGGVVAFKANTYNTKKVYITPNSAGICTVEVLNKVLTDNGIQTWVTDKKNTPCIFTSTTTPIVD